MSDYVFTAPKLPSVPVEGETALFPVRRIFCVGRNYAAHAREMGKDPDREPPFFFMKPADTLVLSGATIPYPPETNEFHYEIELVVAIGGEGTDVPVAKALDLVYGYGVGIDLTRRDLQQAAKDMGRPWDWGKGFDLSAPITKLHKVAKTGHPAKGRVWLAVNGKVRQDGDLTELIWPVPDVISIISRSMTLKPGDLIYTGTPAGVGAVGPGDQLTGGVDGVDEIALTIGPRAGAK
jgi:fumarylpyruvate hydrolase